MCTSKVQMSGSLHGPVPDLAAARVAMAHRHIGMVLVLI
jgi:hypothetical protein